MNIERDKAREAKVLNRVTKEAEAALGGKAVPVMVDDLILYLHYSKDGYLAIGGKTPKSKIPALLRSMAKRLEAQPGYRA